MKVAWLCNYPINRMGDIPVNYRKKDIHPVTWIINLANALTDNYKNVELHIITATPLINRSFTKTIGSITCHVLRDFSAVPFLKRGWPKYFPVSIYLKYFPLRLQVSSLLKELNPDLIHAHGTEEAWGLIAIEQSKPHIISMQGIVHKLSKHYPKDKTFKLRIPLEKEVLINSNYFISKTSFSTEFINQINPSAKIYEIENTMHHAFFEVSRTYFKKNRILFVGNPSPAKGLGELCEAVSRIKELDMTVVTNRGSRYLDKLKEEYRDLNIDWKKSLTSEEIAKEMETVDMLVLPSHMDTSPNVISEAMCAGLPVVATNIGGIPNMIINGKTGVLVPLQDVDSLVEAINFLLNNEDKMMNMGKLGKSEAAKRFAPHVAAEKVYEAYMDVIENFRNTNY